MVTWYRDGADNNVEENSSVFSLIRMRFSALTLLVSTSIPNMVGSPHPSLRSAVPLVWEGR